MLQKPLETLLYNKIMEIIRSVAGEKQKQLKSLYNKITWILFIWTCEKKTIDIPLIFNVFGFSEICE